MGDPIEGPPYAPRHDSAVIVRWVSWGVLDWGYKVIERRKSLGEILCRIGVVFPVRQKLSNIFNRAYVEQLYDVLSFGDFSEPFCCLFCESFILLFVSILR